MMRRPRKKTRRPQPGRARTNVSAGVQRLQKVLAAAGMGSRRQCEELILAGRVDVDGEVADQLGTKVDPQAQRIRVDGMPLPEPKRIYYAVNKPDGVVSTNRDPTGRPRVIDLLPKDRTRLFPVGRLDLHSEGLILLTNDGEMANRLTHPRYGVEKVYRVLVAGNVDPTVLKELRRGIRLAEGIARVQHAEIRRRYKKSTVLEMVLREGQNREIRRVMARVGHKVMRLVRIAMGPVRLGKLPPGEFRRLTPNEIDALRRVAYASNEKAELPEEEAAAGPKHQRGGRRDAPKGRSAATRPGKRAAKGTGKQVRQGKGRNVSTGKRAKSKGPRRPQS